MNQDTKTEVQEFEYKAEMKQLLHLIIHSLYTHPEVFLRELVSNASDALNKLRLLKLTNHEVLDPELPLKISIEVDEKNHVFTIEDTGVGMTREDLIERIGTVASSGTVEFLQALKEEGKSFDGDLIGQFGVGFYSVFMVTDEVTIETRHYAPGSRGYRWKSVGEGKFIIEEIDRQQRGTKISFTLKKDAEEFCDVQRIKSIIQRYSNFVNFPIYVGSEQVNTIGALWHRKKEDIKEEELNEFYKFVSNDFNPPLGHLHLNIEGRVNFKALVFIPQSPPLRLFDPEHEKSLHLYSNRVFIQDDCRELVPEYLIFLKGVVDTEDLPLNVSREVTQSSPVMTKIREIITSRVLSFLEDWAKNDPEKYDTFFKNFGRYIKLGINLDPANRERLIDLLRFESTKTKAGELTSLREYVTRMNSEQKEIYFITGDSREALEKNPNLEYFAKNDIEVLLLTDQVDVFTIGSIPEYDGKQLKSIEKADIDIKDRGEDDAEALSDEEVKEVFRVFRETLGGKVEDVVESKRLVDSAATLVVGKHGLDPHTERMMKLIDKDFSSSKKILEINLRHPLIRNLARLSLARKDDEFVKNTVLQVYEGALLIENNLESPEEFVRRMTEIMVRASATKES
ncbi:MAG: molecular chaperone HtpG [Chlorobi bacterium]|nr:molecular chaperone HtpG [Chlorobiota bacterium]